MKFRSHRYQGCQVLSVTPDGRRLWQFHVGKQEVTLAAETTSEAGKAPPKRNPAQDWRALVRPQLNIALLPAESVFVRAIQLPATDPGELPALVEFQLDKISPLPLNQVVWTAVGVPHPDGLQQTALVTIAARAAVEEFLDREVAAGFTADQLDLPLVRWWSGLKPQGDGLWLLLATPGEGLLCLAGWYLGGVWHDVTLLHLPPGAEAAAALTTQLGQMAWAGEMEGWLKAVPEVCVGAEDAVVEAVKPALADWSGRPVHLVKPPDPTTLATASAQAMCQPAGTSLMPAEWAAAQRQKFIDRLWLTGLGALGVAYLGFLFVFLVWLNVRKYQRDEMRSDVTAMGVNYTNTLQLKAQVAILEEQVALRYAALDAWRAVVNILPAELTLTQLDFQRGRTLLLAGTVSPEATTEVTKFNSELKKADLGGQPLFATIKPAKIESRPGGAASTWSFEAELRRNDTP